MELVLENPRRAKAATKRKRRADGRFTKGKAKKRTNPRVTTVRKMTARTPPKKTGPLQNKRKKRASRSSGGGLFKQIQRTAMVAAPVALGGVGAAAVANVAYSRFFGNRNPTAIEKAAAVAGGGLAVALLLKQFGKRKWGDYAMQGGMIAGFATFLTQQLGPQLGLSGLGMAHQRQLPPRTPPILPEIEMSADAGARDGLPTGVYTELANGQLVREGVADYVPMLAGLGDYVPRYAGGPAQPYSVQPPAPPRRRLIISQVPVPSNGAARASALQELRRPGQSIIPTRTQLTTQVPASARIQPGQILRNVPPPDITATAFRMRGASGASLADHPSSGTGSSTLGQSGYGSLGSLAQVGY